MRRRPKVVFKIICLKILLEGRVAWCTPVPTYNPTYSPTTTWPTTEHRPSSLPTVYVEIFNETNSTNSSYYYNETEVPTSFPSRAPSTLQPTTAMPSTAVPSTSIPSTAMPSTLSPTISHIPSSVPTTASPSLQPTTSLPTAAPTIEPRLTLLPGNTTISITKPASSSVTIYVINLSDQPLQQCLMEKSSSDLAYEIWLDNVRVLASNSSSVSFDISNVVGQNAAAARLILDTSTVHRGAYELTFLAVNAIYENVTHYSCPDISFTDDDDDDDDDQIYAESQVFRVRANVDTVASAATTTLVLNTTNSNGTANLPILGNVWEHAVAIHARDSSGDIVLWEPVDSFEIELSRIDIFLQSYCLVQPHPHFDYYGVQCWVPLVGFAGVWRLSARLNGIEFFGENISVLCPPGYYEMEETFSYQCRDCDELDGTICDHPGLNLQTIGLESNKYRISESSTHIYDCDFEGACRTPEVYADERGVAAYNSFGSHLCKDEHHGGPLCGVCRRFSRYDYGQNKCVNCQADKQSRLRRFSISVAVLGLIFILIIVGIIEYARRHGGAEDLQKFLEGAVHGGGSKTLRELERNGTRKSTGSQQSSLGDESVESPNDKTPKEIEQEEKAEKRRRFWRKVRVSILNKLKILIAFLQVLSSMPAVFTHIRYPPSFRRVSSAWNVMDVYIFRLLALECVFKSWNFYRILYLATIVPIFLGLVIAFVSLGRHWAVRLSRRHRFKMQTQRRTGNYFNADEFVPIAEHTPQVEKTSRAITNQGYFVFLLLTFLVFPSVSTTVFQFFSCKKFRDDGGHNVRVLQQDFSINCRSRTYRRTRIYAMCALAAYPIGIPLLYAALLWRHRKQINPRVDRTQVLSHLSLSEQDKNFILTADREFSFLIEILKSHTRRHDIYVQHLSFLWEEFEPRCYLFSVVDCVRKLALSGILVFLYPNSSTQIGFATLFALIFAKIYSHSRPYIEDEDDIIAEIASEQLVVFFFMSLMLHVSNNCDDEDETNQATRVFARQVFTVVLIVLIAVLVLLVLCVVILQAYGIEELSDKIVSKLSRNGHAPARTARKSIAHAISMSERRSHHHYLRTFSSKLFHAHHHPFKDDDKDKRRSSSRQLMKTESGMTILGFPQEEEDHDDDDTAEQSRRTSNNLPRARFIDDIASSSEQEEFKEKSGDTSPLRSNGDSNPILLPPDQTTTSSSSSDTHNVPVTVSVMHSNHEDDQIRRRSSASMNTEAAAVAVRAKSLNVSTPLRLTSLEEVKSMDFMDDF